MAVDYFDTMKSEILALSMSGNYQCPDWVDFPIALEGAVAAFLETSVVICGGDLNSDCYR